MKRFTARIFGLFAALLLIVFAVANRHPVTVSFDPISPGDPILSVSLPLWIVVFVGIFFGLVAGWTAAWVNQGRWRRAARQARSQLRRNLETRTAPPGALHLPRTEAP
jgi:uncharacterized integral membrane protein